MKLAILDLCVWLEKYQHDQKKFGPVVADWVARGLPEATLDIAYVHEGQDPPDVAAYDGFVLSGSELGVYDEAPWMEPLRAFLQDAKAAGKPIFGICFGHQIMADTFGGKAEKIGDAEVGVRQFDGPSGPIKGHVWHQDQVTQVPPAAKVIASADYCPVAGLAYEFPAMSVQFHPEYSADYVGTFLRRSRGAVLSEAETDAALAQFETSDVSADLYVGEMAAFFRAHL